jgi:hypothetical protein
VLLDENMPHQLRALLPGHDVSTAVYAGFGGFKNGELLIRFPMKIVICEARSVRARLQSCHTR